MSFHIREISRIDKSIETESTLMDALRWGECRRTGVTAKGYRVSFQGDKNILKLIVVMI